ncbi:MAG: T9SS type A sorting domain-containing protein [Bacteroidetes bacterium]|nr:T9SS type A sorting domain-containing protein [Bacteroidota bacterium]
MKTIFLIFLLFNALFSSGQQQTFIKTFNFDSAKTILTGSSKGHNGSYFIYGKTGVNYPYSMFAIKFDQNDDTLFSVKIDQLGIETGSAVVNAKILTPTFDGGCALIGSYAGSEVVFIKLDSTGAITLQRNYGCSYSANLATIIQTRDSAFVILYADKIISSTNGRDFLQVIKLDQNGNIIWNRELMSSIVGDIQEDQNGDLYAVSQGPYLLKLDADGTLLWKNEFSSKNLDKIIGFHGSSIFIKTETASSDPSVLLEIDTNGTIINGNYFQNNKISDVDILSDGSLVMTLISDSISVLKLDSTRQVQFCTTFTGVNWPNYYYTDLIECANNTFLLSSTIGTGLNLSTMLIKIDSTCNTICNSHPDSVGIHHTSVSSVFTIINFPGSNNFLYPPFSTYMYSGSKGSIFSNECSSTSIKETINERTYTLVPNPSNGKSIIYGSAKEKVTLHIFNINGQISASIQNLMLPYDLDLENYPKGMYFVKLYNESKSDVIKMLVQ